MLVCCPDEASPSRVDGKTAEGKNTGRTTTSGRDEAVSDAAESEDAAASSPCVVCTEADAEDGIVADDVDKVDGSAGSQLDAAPVSSLSSPRAGRGPNGSGSNLSVSEDQSLTEESRRRPGVRSANSPLQVSPKRAKFDREDSGGSNTHDEDGADAPRT